MTTLETIAAILAAAAVIYLLIRTLLLPICPKCGKRETNFAEERVDIDVYYCRPCNHSFGFRRGVFTNRYYPDPNARE